MLSGRPSPSKSHAQAVTSPAEGLFEILRVVPAWVGPLIAVGVYLGLRYAVPAWFGTIEGRHGEALGNISRSIAPILALVVVFIWAIAEFVKFRDRRLLDTRTGPGSLRDISWQEFERLVGEAFRRRGYTVRETPAGADGGVDLILERGSRTTLVQCKQWNKRNVDVRTVRELYGVVVAEGAVAGIVVCCGRFTHEARAFAEGEPLELIDGPALWGMIEEVKRDGAALGSGAARMRAGESAGPVAAVGRFPAAGDSSAELPGSAPSQSGANRADGPVPIDGDGFGAPPSCPKCGATMVLHTAKKGPHAGSPFYGCPEYPECKGILQV